MRTKANMGSCRRLAALAIIFFKENLNVRSLGGAAYSGSSWPIDRNETATYLGFDRSIHNAGRWVRID